MGKSVAASIAHSTKSRQYLHPLTREGFTFCFTFECSCLPTLNLNQSRLQKIARNLTFQKRSTQSSHFYYAIFLCARMCVHAQVHTCRKHIVALQIVTGGGRMGRELLSCVEVLGGGKLQLAILSIQKVLGMPVQVLHFNISIFQNYLQWQELC